MFGLELRRKDNIKNLYADADIVLQRAGITKYGMTKDLARVGIGTALQKMISGNHFSVCTITDCAKLACVIIPQERKNFYHTQHCINWSEMLPEARQILIAMILDDFRGILNPEEIKDVAAVES